MRPKAGAELSASSLQSPDDGEATYREKRGQGRKGYVANLKETCDPENDFQLIVKVQTEPNNTEDRNGLAVRGYLIDLKPSCFHITSSFKINLHIPQLAYVVPEPAGFRHLQSA